jgi:amidohydrolase
VRIVSAHGPDPLLTAIGGHGVAAVFCADKPGPTVLLRAELDGLPISDEQGSDHRSEIEGVSHKCGHDGHMAILAGMASRLGKSPPARGRVVLLFQPAEETGKGARRVLDDQVFQTLRPDWSFALHNLPGFELGKVIVRPGPFAAASRGIAVELTGETAHAAEPEAGRSPALAVASLIQAFSALGQFHTGLPEAAKATVTHASLGEEAFGTSPGNGRVLVTLRTYQTALADRLEERCRELAEGTAHTYGLTAKVHIKEPFPLTDNDPQAVAIIEQAAAVLGLEVDRPEHPFPWSEDFGHFTGEGTGALFGLGAGAQHPALHHSTYDFPDELLAIGLDLMERIARLALERFPGAPG